MKDYWVCVPDSAKVVESTNFIAFDAPAQERALRRADLAKCDAVNDAHYEAWELASKIQNMRYEERREAFGEMYFWPEIQAAGYDYAAEKYAAWEKKKAEEAARKIEPGDVYRNRNTGNKVVVIDTTAERDAVMVVNAVGHLYGMTADTFRVRYARTGEHTDSSNILDMVDMLKED